MEKELNKERMGLVYYLGFGQMRNSSSKGLGQIKRTFCFSWLQKMKFIRGFKFI